MNPPFTFQDWHRTSVRTSAVSVSVLGFPVLLRSTIKHIIRLKNKKKTICKICLQKLGPPDEVSCPWSQRATPTEPSRGRTSQEAPWRGRPRSSARRPACRPAPAPGRWSSQSGSQLGLIELWPREREFRCSFWRESAPGCEAGPCLPRGP